MFFKAKNRHDQENCKSIKKKTPSIKINIFVECDFCNIKCEDGCLLEYYPDDEGSKHL
jgi:hypothetical protein